MFRTTTLALALAATLGTAQAQLSDGVVAINQTSALAGNVTAGDAAGFPVTISKSGTYRLTSNLVVPAGIDGIVIVPGLEVTIDLGGFQIVGPAACDGGSWTCFSQVTHTAGIRVASDASSLTVRNGRIRGFSEAGVSGRTDPYAQGEYGTVVAEDLRLWNNGTGIHAATLMASRIAAKGNGFAVYAKQGLVQHSMAQNNYNGFYVIQGRISESMASNNKNAGFLSGSASLLMHFNVANGNGSSTFNNYATATNAF